MRLERIRNLDLEDELPIPLQRRQASEMETSFSEEEETKELSAEIGDDNALVQ